MTRPVTSATRPKISTWLIAFWPTVASRTRSTACGAPGSTFFMTRMIFFSSAISSARFCRRPAVSISITPAPRSRAALIASKATAEASPPRLRAMTGHPMRSPQTRNCSIAAARNVSPAASRTLFPLLAYRAASLPMVVVLPEPFTPTTRMTKGCLSVSISSGWAYGVSARSISTARTALTSSTPTSLS